MHSNRWRAVVGWSIAFVVLMSALPGATPAAAQSTAKDKSISAPERPLSPVEIDALVARLGDREVRELLIRELRRDQRAETTAAAGAHGNLFAALVGGVQVRAAAFRDALGVVATGALAAPAEFPRVLDRLAEGRGGFRLVTMIAILAGLVVLGFAGEGLVRRATTDMRQRIINSAPASLSGKLGRILLRSGIDLMAAGVFCLIAFGLFFAFVDAGGTFRIFASTYIGAFLTVRAVDIASRVFFAPQSPNLRLAPLSNEGAAYVHRWIMRSTYVGAFGWLTCGLLEYLGMGEESHIVLVALVGLAIAALAIGAVWRQREPVARWLRREAEPARDRQRPQITDAWHVFVIVYIGFIWIVWVASLVTIGDPLVGAGIGSLAIIVALPIVDRLLQAIIERALLPRVPQATRATDDEDGLDDFSEYTSITRPSPERYVVVLVRAVRLLLLIGAALLLLLMWGVDVASLLGGSANSAIGNAALDIGITLFLAYVVWGLINAAMAPYGRTGSLPAGEESGGASDPNARLRTLLPLLRAFLLAGLSVITAMIVLSAIGVEIGPLLAGAGVVGLAIGFGAQSLVRDIFAGIFFLVDDAFRVGEYIEIGNIRGEVEAISIRSFRLRHHRGAIQTVPFGEIKSITNYNRDWVIYKMNFRVPFDTDVQKVKKIIKQIGADMMLDPDLASRFIQPLKSQGIFSMEDGMVIRTKFMCKPREQFLLRREAYHRIQKAFEENGISFAYRNVTVHFGGDADDEDRTKVAAGAVGSALSPGTA